MIDNKTISEKLIKDFTENYMGKVFYFCLRKTGDSYEAEDLTSEITLDIISALGKGTIPRNFSAWVWQISRNKYSKWAAGKSRKLKRTESSDVEGFDFEDDYRFEETLVDEELLALMKRELAFISSDYRNILVAFYLEDRKVQDIASSLGLPEGTVKTKLFRARKILKEGIDMAREFGRRSYKPENVSFSNSCDAFGDNGQPWTILNHSMYKNIFLEVYGNPETAEQLALELGIALPYMEDELEYLVKETFLIKNGDKYETSFPIISKDAQIRLQEEVDAWTPKATEMLENFVDTICSICEKNGKSLYGNYQTYEDAKWTLLPIAFDYFRRKYWMKDFTYTKRPDNGAWDIVGFEDTGIESLPFIGLNAGLSHNENEPYVYWGQYRYSMDDICNKTPGKISQEEAYSMKLIHEGKIDEVKPYIVENLVKYGYLKKSDIGYELQILVLEDLDSVIKGFSEADQKIVNDMIEDITAYFKIAYDFGNEIVKKDLPKAIRDNKKLTQFASHDEAFDRRYVFMHALNTGWIKYDENTSDTVGAFLRV
ncbi:MAG: sigma-70 family RNA polymerase sigma factor [Ruminococcaceae bacterium]|nr:sigma-70 family RNA polymerase sigma factor [Oscillospiraceae bacterium]